MPANGLTTNLVDEVEQVASSIRHKLINSDHSGRANPIKALVVRIDLAADALRLQLRPQAPGLTELNDVPLEIIEPIRLARRGVEAKLVLRNGGSSKQPAPKLVELIARSHRRRDRLIERRQTSMTDLAEAEGVSRWDISRHLPLAFLAPDIVQAILDGRQPIGLTVNKLKHALPLPLDCREQRGLLGFDA